MRPKPRSSDPVQGFRQINHESSGAYKLRCFYAFVFEYNNILVNIHIIIYNMQECMRYIDVEYAIFKRNTQYL